MFKIPLISQSIKNSWNLFDGGKKLSLATWHGLACALICFFIIQTFFPKGFINSWRTLFRAHIHGHWWVVTVFSLAYSPPLSFLPESWNQTIFYQTFPKNTILHVQWIHECVEPSIARLLMISVDLINRPRGEVDCINEVTFDTALTDFNMR